ncbi:MFS transporter [Numidum massiliense]|uniref:MFS transporter n=1 Tax=Numidum massiliense TaxID=1522315 RepID=UPI0006D59AC6|nr:MFS transporter [Numidum massiliense]
MSKFAGRLGVPPAGRWLLAATLVTTVGNGMHTLATGKLLYDSTGSVAAFGAVIIFEQVISFLMQVVAGPKVDRSDPKRTCVQVELIRGGLLIGFALAMLVSHNVFLWIMLMTLSIKVTQPFYRAATFALAPAVMSSESLGRFNGYSNICLQGGQLLGVALAGVVIHYWGAPAAFLINGVTFIFSAVSISFITVPHAEIVRATGMSPRISWKQLLKEWREFFLLLRREIGLGWHLMLNTVDSLAVILFNLVLVPLVAVRYGGSAYWLSIVDGAFAVGAMATAVVVAPLTNRWGSHTTVVIGVGGQAVCFLLLGLTDQTWLTLGLTFGIGACNTISWTVLMTTLQLRVQGRPIKGRIGTARNLLTSVTAAALVPLVSKTLDFSLEWAFILSGGICLAFTAIAIVFGLSRVLGANLLGEHPQGKHVTTGRG